MTKTQEDRGNILIVDDTRVNLDVLTSILEKQNYEVRVVTNGHLALSAIKVEKPDLILLDIRMPGIDGYEVCRRIKADKATKNIPIIFISSLAEADDKLKGFQVGGVDYITKPFYTEEVLARVNIHLRLKHTLDKLALSNEELEQFAYIVSHDLREPLRMVTSYLTLLEKRYKNQLDDDADDYIYFAVDGAKRMEQLITDLLSYSRAGRIDRPFVLTNCEAILGQIFSNLEVQIAERGATITHDPMPTIMADETQLTQLLQNLIGNAIKFHDEHPPVVHVGVKQRANDWLFSVRDNGIGIPPDRTKDIFNVFERLHGRNEYEGTGIGLAICKKIVDRHNGRIWVESEPGHGSTFLFTIPQHKT